MTDSLSEESNKKFDETALSKSISDLIRRVNNNFDAHKTLLPEINFEEQRRNLIVGTAATVLGNQIELEKNIDLSVSYDRSMIYVFDKRYEIHSDPEIMRKTLIASFDDIVKTYALDADNLAGNIDKSDIVTKPGYVYEEEIQEIPEKKQEL